MKLIYPLGGTLLPLEGWRENIRYNRANGSIGHFGYTRRDRHGNPKLHNGIDLRGSLGDPVLSPFPVVDGAAPKVRLAGWQKPNRDGTQGYGIRVELAWTVGPTMFSAVFAHLCAVLVNGNEHVFPGQAIGILGRTGNVGDDPTHLHLGVKRGTDWIDPLAYLFEDHIRLATLSQDLT